MVFLWTKKILVWGAALLVLVHCATGSSPDKLNTTVLEPVEETKKEQLPLPSFQRLANLLKSLGYEAVGMQFESAETLDLLFQVFSDPRLQNRRIKEVYTGLQMFYEPKSKALTIGGLASSTGIVDYIQKHVPLEGQETPEGVKPPPGKLPSRSRVIYKKEKTAKPAAQKTPKKAGIKKTPAPSVQPKIERAPEPTAIETVPEDENPSPPQNVEPNAPADSTETPSNPGSNESFEIPPDSPKPVDP